jgi:TolB protein
VGRASGLVAAVLSAALVAAVGKAEPAQRLYVFHTHPTWSPGGLQLLYERRVGVTDPRNGECCLKRSSALYVTGPRGSRRLAWSEGAEQPAWSPDGKRIAFVRRNRVYVVRADGTGARPLHPDRLEQSSPAWSPDGRRVSFWRGQVDRGGICVVGVDGRGFRRLVGNADLSSGGSWSPDGRRVAFARNYDVWVVGADGSGVRQLSRRGRPGLVAFYDPAWSPDGRRIAFHGDRGVYVMRADGTGIRLITRSPNELEQDHHAVWSPSGRRIAFAGTRGPYGHMDIYTVAPDGSGLRRVTG